MQAAQTLVERAYSLARSGQCADTQQLARQLKAEKYDAVDSHLGAPGLRRTLATLCKAARADAMGEPAE